MLLNRCKLYLGDYYSKTTGVVTNQLKKWLENIPDRLKDPISEEIKVWEKWINIWNQFNLESFLQSTVDVIKAKVPEDQWPSDMGVLEKLLLWDNNALRGYSVFTYTEQLDQSLVQYLRDDLGKWWSPNMHTLIDLDKKTQVFKTSVEFHLNANSVLSSLKQLLILVFSTTPFYSSTTVTKPISSKNEKQTCFFASQKIYVKQ